MSDRYFSLNVRMENAEMQTADTLAEALETVVYQLRSIGYASPVGHSRLIRDINGNTVGNWVARERKTPEKEAKELVKQVFEIRDGDVQQSSASYIRSVIADVIEGERGPVR